MIVVTWVGYPIPPLAISEWMGKTEDLRAGLKGYMLFDDETPLDPGDIEIADPLRISRPAAFVTIHLVGATYDKNRRWKRAVELLANAAKASLQKHWPAGQQHVVIQVLIETVLNAEKESDTFERKWTIQPTSSKELVYDA